jgi:transcriptional regulator with XRE-family HTH domain
METLGERIRCCRNKKWLSQQQLADLLGITKGAVSQWENGRSANIKLVTVLKLCEVLGVTLDYLVHGPVLVSDKPSADARGVESGTRQPR